MYTNMHTKSRTKYEKKQARTHTQTEMGKVVGTKRDIMSKLLMNIQEPHTETLKTCSRHFSTPQSSPSTTYNVCK